MLLRSFALLVGVVSFITYSVARRFIKWYKLRHIPGPMLAAWSRLWLLRHVISGKLCKELEDVCGTYGSLVRVGPDWVVCCDPAEIRRIWSVHSGYHRSSWYKATRMDPHDENVLTMTDNKAHHQRRAHLLAGYGGKGIENQERLVDEQVEKLISLVNREYVSTQQEIRPCNLARTMQYLTQDIITTIGFSKTVGYLDVNQDIFGVLQTSEMVLLPAHVVSIFPLINKFLQLPMVKPFLPKPTDRHGVGRFLGVVKSYVDKRYRADKIRNKDIIQSFIDSGLSRSEVESEALVTLFGGTDTTSTGLRNIIFFLSTNPCAYRLLQAEIDASIKTAARPIITDDHAKSFPYLQACIKEGLRLWPPSMGLMGKVSDQDDVVCGTKIPAGTQIGWAALAVMKDRSVFGDDTDVFEPRRWMDSDPARLKEMEATYGLVFAAGTRWECLGKRLAYVELGKVLFELFYRFDFSMMNPMEPFQWFNHGLTVQQGMYAKITKREAVW